MSQPSEHSLKEVAALFIRQGLTAFGGPAAHIALMEDEVVRRRAWIPRERFLDLLAMANLIPGPNSTEMAIMLGYERAGWPGLFVAGAGFILPAALATLAVAWAYVRYGAQPQAAGFLYGVKPVIAAILFQALWRLGRTAVRNCWLFLLGAAAVVAAALGTNPLVVIFGGGLLAFSCLLARRRAEGGKPVFPAALALPALPAALPAAASVKAPFGLAKLFLFFLKTGSVIFGSGYVLLAFLRADLVTRWHWMTESQLLDAIAAGQITPGPVFSTATFIGYVLGGVPGAFLATAGIFLPAFFFAALSGFVVPRLRRSEAAGASLDGVVVCSLALMAVVGIQLGRAAIVDLPTAAIALAAGGLLLGLGVNSLWLILGAGALGLSLAGRV